MDDLTRLMKRRDCKLLGRECKRPRPEEEKLIGRFAIRIHKRANQSDGRRGKSPLDLDLVFRLKGSGYLLEGQHEIGRHGRLQKFGGMGAYRVKGEYCSRT